jgi:hypothetical protein
MELAEDLGEAAIAEDDGAGHAGADEDDHAGEAHARLHQRHGCEWAACAKGVAAEETLAWCGGGRGGGRMRAERGWAGFEEGDAMREKKSSQVPRGSYMAAAGSSVGTGCGIETNTTTNHNAVLETMSV